MGDFYFKHFINPENQDEFYEFGIKDSDDYCEIELDGTLRFTPDSASDDFKKLVRTFFKNTYLILPRSY